MRIRFNKIGEVRHETYPVSDTTIRIGSNARNNIVLKSPFVANLAALRKLAGLSAVGVWPATGLSMTQTNINAADMRLTAL